jgi:hypothetical protein
MPERFAPCCSANAVFAWKFTDVVIRKFSWRSSTATEKP